MKSLILISFVSFIFVGCTYETDKKIPHTPSPILNEFVESSSIQHLDLDNSPIKHVQLNNNNIIYSTYDETINQTSKISRIWGFVYFNERFYIYDNINSSVFQILKNGNIEGPLTSKGKGPGEHLLVTSLRSNNKYIYLPDWNNARINIYNENMVLEREIGNFKGVYKTKYIDLNDQIMLFSNPKKAGFISEAPDEGLITVSHINDPVDTITTILPQIIPDGYQPQVYNTPNFSINRKNEIAASYAPLPWIFLFDDTFDLKLTLVLSYSGFEEMNIPAMDFFKPIGNEGYGGAMPIRQFKLMDNGDLFISVRKELIRLSLDSNGSYQTVGRYQFYVLNEESPIWISDLFLSETTGEFFAGNWDYLFHFDLPE